MRPSLPNSFRTPQPCTSLRRPVDSYIHSIPPMILSKRREGRMRPNTMARTSRSVRDSGSFDCSLAT